LGCESEIGSDGASFCIKPGRRNVAGDTLFEAWMPLQPAPQMTALRASTSRMQFQFSFTDASIGVVMGLATTFSEQWWFICHPTLRVGIGCVGIVLVTLCSGGETQDFASRAEKKFKEAQARYRAASMNVEAAVQLARTAFDWAEFANSDDHRAEIADIGIAVARDIIAREPNSAAGHYWLGMNLGQLARTKSLGALKLVKEMESEFLRARDLDEKYDYAGPDRSLGLLYRDAPGWPTSIGSKKKAHQFLERAVAVSNEFPENHLCLLEAYVDWGERQNIERQLKSTEQVLAEARKKFTGEEWASSWADWENRLRKLKAKAAEPKKPIRTKGAQ
jgi:hypothetical protein